MNYKVIGYYIGQILKVVAAFLLLPVIVGLCYKEYSHFYFLLITAALYEIMGLLLAFLTKKGKRKLGNKEGLAVVGLAWIVISAVGALPFVMDGCIPNYIDALFETVSGFTTTGATILTDIDGLPKCMLFWRSFTHWLGGMGILVFILAIMPGTDGSTFHLFRFEAPGPQVGKLVSKVRINSAILYGIYLGFTLLEFFLLLFGIKGSDKVFHSIIIAMGTAGTGGFAATANSVADFDSLYVEIVIMAFMFIFSINFNLYYLMLLRRFKAAFADEEMHFYVFYLVLSIVAVTICNLNFYGNFFTSLRYSSFAVVSFTSSTGYATDDITQWSMLADSILLVCMFFGGCAGSTSGGFKVSRIVILMKSAYNHLLHVLRPNSIQIVKLNRKVLSREEVSSVERYFLIYSVFLALAFLLISFDGKDTMSTVSAVFSCLNNMGPGFGAYFRGSGGTFAGFSYFSKIVEIILMLAGRLEIFPVLLLFVPKTWSKNF